MNVYPFTQGMSPIKGADGEYPDYYANMLFAKEWGAFEIFTYQNTLQCGHDYASDDDSVECSQGKFRPSSIWLDYHPYGNGESFNYVMQDYLAYAPVGTDITAWQESGYFDKDATQTAAKDKKVDATRPFIVVRDSSLYDDTSYPTSDLEDHELFMPKILSNPPRVVPMKPAISDKTVYYLVEQNDPDWDTLKDAKVKGIEKEDPLKNADKLTRDTLKELAGEYVLSSGNGGWYDRITIEQDGSYVGEYRDYDLGGSSDPAKYPNGSLKIADYTGRLSKAKKNDDGTITMDITYKLHGTIGEVKDVDGTETTTIDAQLKNYSKVTIYPAGYNHADFSRDIRTWAPWYGDDSYLSKQTRYPVIVASDKNGDLAFFNTNEMN